ncbi:MAG: ABC transporter ATP-binding protein [Bdellovibrionales bacterium]
MNLLQVTGLKKSYSRGFIPRRVNVLKGLNFSVPAGKVTGFLGGNGAGKTTTMRCILGLDYPDSGQIELFGQPLSVQSKRRLGFLPERPYFYEHLTGVEFLEFYAYLTSPWKKQVLRDRITQLLKRVDLEHAKNRPLRTYSKGMLQKIGVAQALIHDPELIILDEPMSGLDPDGRMALNEIILETAKKGTAVFFTSHLLYDTERLCERLVVMKDGVAIYEGLTETLLEQSGQALEIFFSANGIKQNLKIENQEKLQGELQRLMSNGASIIEVRRTRASLEEVFVNMALRGGRK